MLGCMPGAVQRLQLSHDSLAFAWASVLGISHVFNRHDCIVCTAVLSVKHVCCPPMSTPQPVVRKVRCGKETRCSEFR